MTQEEKELLLEDLCARLGHRPKFRNPHFIGVMNTLVSIEPDYSEDITSREVIVNGKYTLNEVKPYLRPMSSMTLEVFQGLRSVCPHAIFNQTNVTDWIVGINGSDYGRISRVDEISKFIDWLNANHFDYRGLIEKGLALEAPDGMYNKIMENDKDIQSIIADSDNLIKILEDGKKEDKVMKDGIDFLINKWKTNKRWFRDDAGRIATEDVIKTVFNFAWASKRDFDINKDNPNFN